MKIGRNDPCPCGSGKKYKKCCLTKRNRPLNEKIADVIQSNGLNPLLGDLLYNAYRLIIGRMAGMCHALSSVLYVGISETGYEPEICIGEVDDPLQRVTRFDHSWILLNGKIIDIAIAYVIDNPILHTAKELTGPIILNNDLKTGRTYDMVYGVQGFGIEGLGPETRFVMNAPFCDYMDGGHLWDLLKSIYPGELNVAELREKYRNVSRKYVVNS